MSTIFIYCRHFNAKKIHFPFLSDKKILLRKTGRYLAGSLDTNQFYTIQSLYNIVLKTNEYTEEYVLGLLNSKLFTYIYNHFYITNPEVFPYIKRRHLDLLPVFKADHSDQQTISKLTKQLCALGPSSPESKELIAMLDSQIYKLYDLSEDEIKSVESEKYD